MFRGSAPVVPAVAAQPSQTAAETFSVSGAGAAAQQAPPTAASNPTGWYFCIDGQQQGPISLADLKEQFASGRIVADDLVWKEGMADWESIGAVPELRGAAPATGGRQNSRMLAAAQRFCFACGAALDARA
jgi:hypothetical protein